MAMTDLSNLNTGGELDAEGRGHGTDFDAIRPPGTSALLRFDRLKLNVEFLHAGGACWIFP
jgi:hypothetical protein